LTLYFLVAKFPVENLRLSTNTVMEKENLDWGFKTISNPNVDSVFCSTNEFRLKNEYDSSDFKLKNSDWTDNRETNTANDLFMNINDNDKWIFKSQNFSENETAKNNLFIDEQIKNEIKNKIEKFKKEIDFSSYFSSNELIANKNFFNKLHEQLIKYNFKEKANLVFEQAIVIYFFYFFR
jgi:hypothetical protein